MNELDAQSRRYIQIALAVLFVAYWLFARYIQRIDLTVNTPSYLASFITGQGGLVEQLIAFVLEMFWPTVLIHLLPFGAGWYLAQRASAGLVKDLFDLPDLPTAQQALGRYLSPDAPLGETVTIRRTEFTKDRLQKPLLRYGGPGKVAVKQGDVITTERNARFMRVLGPGVHQLKRYESVRAALDTRPQERAKFGIQLYTQDGIELRTDLAITFHLGRQGQQPSQREPYPFEAQAVRLAAYTQTILEDDHFLNWEALPLIIMVRKLRDIVAQRALDRLLYPHNPELKPHELVRERLERESKPLLQACGVELVSTRLGRLEVPDAVTQQRIDYWRAYWHRQQREKTGTGEAEAHRQLETARAHAKVAAIKKLVRDIQLEQPPVPLGNPQEILALRLTEAMSKMVHQAPVGQAPTNLTNRIEALQQQLLLSRGQDE